MFTKEAVYAVAATVVIGSLYGAVKASYNHGYTVAKGEALEAARKAQEAADVKARDVARAYEQARAKLEQTNEGLRNEITEIKKAAVYYQPCFDADGVRALNNAIRGDAKPTTEPDKPVRGASIFDRGHGRKAD